MWFDVTLFNLGFLFKLFNLLTLFEILLFGVQPFNNFRGQCVFASIEVFTKAIPTAPNGFTPTEAFLSDRGSTDMKPHVVGSVGSLEVFTILGVC